MTDTTPEQEFAVALAEFQADLPHVGKGQTADTGSYSYDYADLTQIHEAALPRLTDKGFSFSAFPTLRENGTFVLRYSLRHSGGHCETGEYPLPANGNPQQIGSAITYGRRYCFLAVTGIAPGGEDDDGAKAAETTIRQPRPDRVTDVEWIEDFRHRLLLAANVTEVDALRAEARQVYNALRLHGDDAKALKVEMDERAKELTGEPVTA